MSKDDALKAAQRSITNVALMHFLKDIDSETLAMTVIYAQGGGLRSNTILEMGVSLQAAHELLSAAALRVRRLIERDAEDMKTTMQNLGDDEKRRAITITEAEANAVGGIATFARTIAALDGGWLGFWNHYGPVVKRFVDRELREENIS